MMTSEKEISDAAVALQQWFISQDINPSEAGIIMCRLMAALFVAKNRDLHTLQTAVNATASLLALDIVECLNVPR